MKIIDRGIVFNGKDTPEISSCTFPAMCQLPNGRIIVSFKGSPKKVPYNIGECGYTCFSDDGGKTYSLPIRKFEAPIVNFKPTTIRTLYYQSLGGRRVLAVLNAVDASCDELPYFNEETEGLKDTYIMYAISSDNGETFDELKKIEVESFIGLPLPLTAAPIVLRNGKIAIQFEVNKKYYEGKPWKHHSVVIYSKDGGVTWGDEVIITDHPTRYYWDQRISVLDSGKLIDLFWSYDREKKDYINIHSCESLDNGKSFSSLFDTGLSGQAGNLVDIGSSKICCTYINRDKSPIIYVAISDDFARTWENVLTVYDSDTKKNTIKKRDMNEAWDEMGKFAVGHPFMIKTNDNHIIVYYYAGLDTHRTDINWVKISLT